jgi:tungstate transport system substrate-binding protein
MGATLNIASETEAYTLTDRGTFEQFAGKRALKELWSGDARLLNTYAVIADPSDRGGMSFATWIAEGEGRSTIASLLASGKLKGFSLSAPSGTSPAPPGTRRKQ